LHFLQQATADEPDFSCHPTCRNYSSSVNAGTVTAEIKAREDNWIIPDFQITAKR
jgi:hypothetical protein